MKACWQHLECQYLIHWLKQQVRDHSTNILNAYSPLDINDLEQWLKWLNNHILMRKLYVKSDNRSQPSLLSPFSLQSFNFHLNITRIIRTQIQRNYHFKLCITPLILSITFSKFCLCNECMNIRMHRSTKGWLPQKPFAWQVQNEYIKYLSWCAWVWWMIYLYQIAYILSASQEQTCWF